ncbi:MAG: hypothetical protein CME71_04990 [Halobacteriovorax sp.]|nr:hypothetical protein [Halobacteriovorax sp.]
MNSDLLKPLSDLNNWLASEELDIQLVVIGAFAIHLHGFSNRMTMDIDTVTPLTDNKLLQQINEIGEKYGLPRWLNDQADNLIMPDDFEKRLLVNSDFSHIKLFYVSRLDLIKLKVAAYFYRGSNDSKDKDDLISLKLTLGELEEALRFLKQKHSPDTSKFKADFSARLMEISHELNNLVQR